MFRDAISFGIDTEEGFPYVETCRGRFRFDTVEQLAEFVGDRVRTRLVSYAAIWDSFETTLERHDGQQVEREHPHFWPREDS